jgi:hypothetical protein
VAEKINSLTELLEEGEEKLDYFQETVANLTKKVNEMKFTEVSILKVEPEKPKSQQTPSQPMKKSRISVRRTVDAPQLQKTIEQAR